MSILLIRYLALSVLFDLFNLNIPVPLSFQSLDSELNSKSFPLTCRTIKNAQIFAFTDVKVNSSSSPVTTKRKALI